MVVFASVVALTPPSASDLLRDDFLLMVATECRSSINGVRTFLEIKQRMHIPYETYACTLKAVKRWAMQRKVYGNLFTYPNGVTLAIMVARLSQIFPSASPSTFFRSFFRFYSQWFRKEQPSAPIFITQDIHPRGARIAGMPMCWDARREHCKDELIPVINPAYPYVNASHAVGKCGYQFFLAELTRANRLLESSPSVLPLDELWEPYTMTKDFTLFVAVHVACVAPSEAECAEAFGPWKGLVESKVRMFIYALEYSVDVRPFSKAMPVKQLQDSARGLFFQETMFVMGVKERKEGIPVSKRLVARSFQELQCALRAAEQAHPGNEPFVRDHKRMKDPWVSYHSVYDSNFRAQLGDLLH